MLISRGIPTFYPTGAFARTAKGQCRFVEISPMGVYGAAPWLRSKKHSNESAAPKENSRSGDIGITHRHDSPYSKTSARAQLCAKMSQLPITKIRLDLNR